MPLLETAISLAVEAHAGQKDKAGKPYILHPLRLMLQMETESEMITAALHDVVEDSDTSMEQLRELGFPPAVLEALQLLTHDSENVPYEAYVAAIKENQIARRVKLADLAHNMDVRRLPPPLTESDWRRLNKYRLAWKMLSG